MANDLLLYMSFEDDGIPYDPAKHSVNEGLVRSVTVSVTENETWVAKVNAINRGDAMKPGRRRVLFLSYKRNGQYRLLFAGRIRSWPMGLLNQEMTFEAYAYPRDVEAAKRALLAGSNIDPYGIMGVGPEPEAQLGASYALIHWSRFDAPARVVSLLEGDGNTIRLGEGFTDAGGQAIPAGTGFIAGSMKLEDPSDPITVVECSVTATWDQAVLRRIDVGATRDDDDFGVGDPGIRPLGTYAFSERKDWNAAWFKPGNDLGDWKVSSSSVLMHQLALDAQGNLQWTTPAPHPEILDGNGVGQFAPYSRQYLADVAANRDMDVAKVGATPVRFIRNFTTFGLQLVGIQTAKRTETVRWRVLWSGQPFAGYDGKVEQLDLKLDDLRGETGYPAWAPGVQYDVGDAVSVQGLVYTAIKAHTSGADTSDSESTGEERRSGTFFADYDLWAPQLIDYTPLGGPGWDLFFGQPNEISGPSGTGTLRIVRDPTPGQRAITFVHRQALARLARESRFTLSFDCPFEFVENIEGSETMYVADPDLPGGEAYGKVIGVSITIGQDGAVASVRLGVHPGGGVVSAPPVMGAYVPLRLPEVGIVSTSVKDDFRQVEAALGAYEYPAVDPGDIDGANVEYDAAGNPKPAKPPRGYNLPSIVESFDPAIELTMSPLQGQVQLPISLVPNGGNGAGIFLWSGPKNIDMGA